MQLVQWCSVHVMDLLHYKYPHVLPLACSSLPADAKQVDIAAPRTRVGAGQLGTAVFGDCLLAV
jgi:hypothetical protein